MIASDGSRPFLLKNASLRKKKHKNLAGYNKNMYLCRRSLDGGASDRYKGRKREIKDIKDILKPLPYTC